MFISFCKVFIDENTFRVRFSWSITFQFPSFFINIVSGSSRDKPNNDVGGLVLMKYLVSLIFDSFLKALLGCLWNSFGLGYLRV